MENIIRRLKNIGGIPRMLVANVKKMINCVAFHNNGPLALCRFFQFPQIKFLPPYDNITFVTSTPLHKNL